MHPPPSPVSPPRVLPSCGHAGACGSCPDRATARAAQAARSRPEAPGVRLLLASDGDVVGVALRSGRLRVPINHGASDVRNAPDSTRKRTLLDFACVSGHDGVAVECPFYSEVTDIGGRRRARQRQATGRARRADHPGTTSGWASLHPAISSVRLRASGGPVFVDDALPQRPDHIFHDQRVLPAVR